MPILHNCCCWGSVRHGSIACGVYTGIYYTVNAVHSFYALRQEICSSIPIIDTNGKTNHVFSHLIFTFSSCGLISTILLFYGLYRNIKYFLIPWIFNMILFTILDIIYIVHALFIHALQWSPSVGIIVIVDFFLNCLNLYMVLCVTSQYQEYRCGRGKANSQNLRTIDTEIPPSPSSTKTRTINNSQPSKPKKTVNFGTSTELGPKHQNSPSQRVDTAPLLNPK